MRRALPAGDVQDAAPSSSARGVVPLNNVTLMISRRGGRLDSFSDDEEDDDDDEDVIQLMERAVAATAAARAAAAAAAAATTPAAASEESSVEPRSSSSSRSPESSSSPVAGGEQEGVLRLFGQVLRRPLWTAPTPAAPAPAPAPAAAAAAAAAAASAAAVPREEGKEEEDGDMVVISLDGPATEEGGAAAGEGTTASDAAGGGRHFFVWDRFRLARNANAAAAATSATTASTRTHHHEEDEDEDEAADADTDTSPHPGPSSSSLNCSPTFLLSACTTAIRRHHLLILWSFGGLVLLRMAFFAFERRDSKLLVFTSFVLALAAYIWWTRRVRQARLEALREAAMASEEVMMMQHIASAREGGRSGRRAGFELVDLEELQSIMLEARRQAELQGGLQQQQRGLSPHSKAALVRFPFSARCVAAGGGEGEEGREGGKEGGGGGKGSSVSMATAGWEEEEEGMEGGWEGTVPKRRPSMQSSSSLDRKQPGGLEVEEDEEEGHWRRESEEEEGEEGREEVQEEGQGGGFLRWLSGGGSSKKEVDVEKGSDQDEDEEQGGRQGGREGGHEGELLKTAHVDKHCSICLGDYEEGETLCVLPCRHSYHDDCLDHWITAHSKCPLCNYDLLLASAAAAATASDSSPSSHGGGAEATPTAPRHGGREGGGEEERGETTPRSRRQQQELQQQQQRWQRRQRRRGEGRGEAEAGSPNVLRIVTMVA